MPKTKTYPILGVDPTGKSKPVVLDNGSVRLSRSLAKAKAIDSLYNGYVRVQLHDGTLVNAHYQAPQAKLPIRHRFAKAGTRSGRDLRAAHAGGED